MHKNVIRPRLYPYATVGHEEEFKRLQERIKELEEEKKSQDEHIELLNQCDDSSTEVIGEMDKELEVKDKRIEELETIIQKCIDSMKGSNCLEEQWLIDALKGGK